MESCLLEDERRGEKRAFIILPKAVLIRIM
jgi:hypothetical protein